MRAVLRDMLNEISVYWAEEPLEASLVLIMAGLCFTPLVIAICAN